MKALGSAGKQAGACKRKRSRKALKIHLAIYEHDICRNYKSRPAGEGCIRVEDYAGNGAHTLHVEMLMWVQNRVRKGRFSGGCLPVPYYSFCKNL